jgi:hypothetical protein
VPALGLLKDLSAWRAQVRWTDGALPKRLCLRVQEAGWLWSGGLALNSPGDLFVKIRHRQSRPPAACTLLHSSTPCHPHLLHVILDCQGAWGPQMLKMMLFWEETSTEFLSCAHGAPGAEESDVLKETSRELCLHFHMLLCMRAHAGTGA